MASDTSSPSVSKPDVTTDEYLAAIKHRRTVYGINDKVPVSNDRIVRIIEQVVLTTPSSYNIQTGRFTILLEEQHKRLWCVRSADVAI